MKTKPKIKQSFDKGARNYESNSDIQRLICHQLVNFFLERRVRICYSGKLWYQGRSGDWV